MESFAIKCIHDHRNPIVKMQSSCLKLFFAAKTLEEQHLANKQHLHLRHILEHLRVEKRSNRTRAVWLARDNLGQITKVVKNLLKYFGFQNKNGMFLYPEEIAVLIETNRLELISTHNQVSIEKAFHILLKTTDLTSYRIYKTLVLLGYKLLRVEQLEGRLSNTSQQNHNKRAIESHTAHTEKRRKKTHSNVCCSNIEILPEAKYIVPRQEEVSEAKYIDHILNSARKIMPRNSQSNIDSSKPDYYIFCPCTAMKQRPDFSLFVCHGNILDNRSFSSNMPSVYATCTDDVAFYSFNDVHLPYI